MFKSHIITLAVCDTVTVLLGDIVLLAFEKILVLFSRHRKTAFLQLHKFLFTTAQIFFPRGGQKVLSLTHLNER